MTAPEAMISEESPEAIAELPLDEYAVEQTPRWWSFSPPTRSQLWIGIAFWGVILLAAILRFWALGARPLHHDESLHAYYSRLLLLNNMENWLSCFNAPYDVCYRYN